jgi:hypothetical protein
MIDLNLQTPLKIVRGDTVIFELEITDNVGNPLNLTDLSVGLYIVDKENLTNFVIQKVQNTHTNPASGKTTITLLPSETRQLRSDKQYLFEIKVFNNNDFVRTIGSGTLIVLEPIKLL